MHFTRAGVGRKVIHFIVRRVIFFEERRWVLTVFPACYPLHSSKVLAALWPAGEGHHEKSVQCTHREIYT
jgi:hypothetical protein